MSKSGSLWCNWLPLTYRKAGQRFLCDSFKRHSKQPDIGTIEFQICLQFQVVEVSSISWYYHETLLQMVKGILG